MQGIRLVIFALFIVVITFVALAGQAQPRIVELSDDAKVTLAGHTPQVVHKSRFLRHADPARVIKVVVGLKLRNERELNGLISSQSNPGSPLYHQYLSPSLFLSRFSPTREDYQKVVEYLRGQEMAVVSYSENRLLVVCEGTVAQVEAAFGVTLNEYLYKGQVCLSNASDPQIARDLAKIVGSITGLNNFVRFKSVTPAGIAVSSASTTQPLGLTPQQLASVYNFPNPNNPGAKHKYTGAGRTIAIATAFSYAEADVNAYWGQFGIVRTGSVTNIPVGGQTNVTHKETTLDLEQLGAQVPGADILVYMGKDGDSTTFELVFNQIVVDNKADVVSMSWGVSEDSLGAIYMSPLHNIFKQAEAQGIVIFCSSGDRGAYDSRKDNQPIHAAHYPASDPHVVSVGGTTLVLQPDGKRKSEIAWSGSGGGVSSEWVQPAWQTGPGVPACGKRATTDVSLAGNPLKGGYAAIYKGRWFVTGGTSLATPNWAALWLLADEACGQRIGNANQTFYQVCASREYSKLFLDITSGSNGDERGPGYSAGPNWDHPTGWGVPDGAHLVEWLMSVSQGHQTSH